MTAGAGLASAGTALEEEEAVVDRRANAGRRRAAAARRVDSIVGAMEELAWEAVEYGRTKKEMEGVWRILDDGSTF